MVSLSRLEIPSPGSTVLLCKWQQRIVEILIELEVNFYVVLDEFDISFMNPDSKLLESADAVYRISHFDCLQELAEVATDLRVQRNSVNQIISFTEYSQFGAGYLDILLRDDADPLHHVASRDKRMMKDLISKAGVKTARFHSMASAAEASESASQFTYPVVVKPATGLGAMDTMRIESAGEMLERLADYATDQSINSRQLIVEEFIDGRELYVDALWRDGAPVYFVLSSYYEPRLALSEGYLPDRELVDAGYVIPAEENPDLNRLVFEFHKDVNSALSIKDGMTHLELFETVDGELIFSEIATRMGGGWIPSMLTHALGHDVWDIVVREAIGIWTLLPLDSGTTFVGGVNFKPDNPGRVTSITSESELESIPGLLHWKVVHGVGEYLDLRSSSDLCVFAVIGAESRAEFEERLAELRRRVRIETVNV